MVSAIFFTGERELLLTSVTLGVYVWTLAGEKCLTGEKTVCTASETSESDASMLTRTTAERGVLTASATSNGDASLLANTTFLIGAGGLLMTFVAS